MAPQQEHGYEHSAPFDSGKLPVGDIHTLHYEQYGNPNGKPALFVHGGPGGSTSLASTVYFSPRHYRLVLYDQRGAGRSTPSGDLRENTSQHLVQDIETLRKHLGIGKWSLVFGGSWGSALSLMYAQAHPEVVGGIVLRGVHTARREEYAWSRGGGAGRIWPDAYRQFLSSLPEADRADPIKGYYKLFTSDDVSEDVKREASREWNRWDITLCSLKPTYEKLEDEKWCMEHARLESHYFSHGSFIEDGQLHRKENIDRIRHIPGEYSSSLPSEIQNHANEMVILATIVQGRYDMITPPKTAWDLHCAWPESRLFWVDVAGHSVKDPGVQTKLTEVCDEFAKLEG